MRLKARLREKTIATIRTRAAKKRPEVKVYITENPDNPYQQPRGWRCGGCKTTFTGHWSNSNQTLKELGQDHADRCRVIPV